MSLSEFKKEIDSARQTNPHFLELRKIFKLSTREFENLIDYIIDSLPELKYLYIKHIETHQLPKKIKNLRNLEELQIDCKIFSANRRIDVLPNELLECPKFKKLILKSRWNPRYVQTDLDLTKSSLEVNLSSNTNKKKWKDLIHTLLSNEKTKRLRKLTCKSLDSQKLPRNILEMRHLEELTFTTSGKLPTYHDLKLTLEVCNSSPHLKAMKLTAGSRSDHCYFELKKESSEIRIEVCNVFCIKELGRLIDAIHTAYPNLKKLHMIGVRTSTLPANIGKLSCLESLTIHPGKLSDLPLEISKLRNLKELKLRDNEFAKIPKALSGLTRTLQSLDFSYNAFSNLDVANIYLGNHGNIRHSYLTGSGKSSKNILVDSNKFSGCFGSFEVSSERIRASIKSRISEIEERLIEEIGKCLNIDLAHLISEKDNASQPIFFSDQRQKEISTNFKGGMPARLDPVGDVIRGIIHELRRVISNPNLATNSPRMQTLQDWVEKNTRTEQPRYPELIKSLTGDVVQAVRAQKQLCKKSLGVLEKRKPEKNQAGSSSKVVRHPAQRR